MYGPVQYSTVQYKAAGPVRAVIPIRYGSKEGVQGRQTYGSKTEATLILCGYSGERANSRGDSTIKEKVRRRKMRKFADNQTDRQANKHRTFQTLRPL